MLSNNDYIYHNLVGQLLNNPISNEYLSHELIGVHVIFEPGDGISFKNEKYAVNELTWYRSCDCNIKNHKGIETNKVWKRCATDDGNVNSNYGHLCFSDENYNQYAHVLSKLNNDVASKQATMIYSRPSIHIEYNDGIHANKDMICTMYTQQFIRDNKLIYIVNMRSNDIWYGMRYDLDWHLFLQSSLINDLHKLGHKDVKPGNIIWNAGSLHCYKNTLNEIKEYYENFGI